MHCDIRLRVSVTRTFTIKHGTHVPLLHVVTYMTRIGYNALFTPLICKGMRGSVDRASASRFRGRRFEHCGSRQILFFIYSLPNIFRLLLIFSLSFL